MSDDAPKDPRYPGKRYHKSGKTAYVQSEAEDRALGAGWYDSPKTAANPPKADPPKA